MRTPTAKKEAHRGMALVGALLLIGVWMSPEAAPAAQPQRAAPQEEQLPEAQQLGELADKLRRAGNLAEAVAALEKKLALERKAFGDMHKEVAGTLTRLGSLHEAREAFAAARRAWQEALALRVKLHGEAHHTVTDLRNWLADADRIEKLGAEDRQLLQTVRAQAEQAGQQMNPATVRQAEPAVQKALEVERRLFGESRPRLVPLLNDLGTIAYFKNDPAAARAYLEQAEKIGRATLGDAHPQLAQVFITLGNLLAARAELDAARPYLQQALAINRKALGEDHVQTATALRYVGQLLLREGDYEAARAHVVQALAVYQRLPGDGQSAIWSTLDTLGTVLKSLGDYQAARVCYERSLDLARQAYGEQHLATAMPLNNLGSLLIAQGDYAAARSHIERAVAICTKALGESHPQTVDLRINLGSLLGLQGEFAAARTHLEKALADCQKRPADAANALTFLGQVLRQQKDYAAAQAHFERALDLSTKALGADHLRTLLCRSRLGTALAFRGDYAAAQGHLERVLEVRQRVLGNDHRHTVMALHDMGMVLHDGGKPAAARPYLEQALAAQLRVGRDLLSGLSEVEALAYVERATHSRDPLLSALRQQSGISAEAMYAPVWETRALASQVLAARRNLAGRTPEAGDLWEALRHTRARLAQLTLAVPPPEKAAARREQLAKLNADKERLERELAAVLAPFRREQQVQRAGVADLAARLPAGVAVLDLVQVTAPDRAHIPPKRTPVYDAFVLRKANNPSGYTVMTVHLGPAAPIDQAVQTWRAALQSPAGKAVAADTAARTLRRLVWEPVEAHLAGCGTVVVLPDAALTAVPWAALPGKKPGSYLLEEYAVATAGHGRQLYGLLTQEPPQGSQLLVAGGLRYDDGAAPPPAAALVAARRGPAREAKDQAPWQYLPGTAAEAQGIAALGRKARQQDRLLQGESATEAALRDGLGRARYVHLATHGFFADARVPSAFRHGSTQGSLTLGGLEMSGARSTVAGRNPLLLSGVVLAGANRPARYNDLGQPLGDDGILTAEEVVDLDLTDTELVVLSACETGLGEVAGGEGVFGLQRAFHLAGARSVVASLWKVDDQATRALMAEFYKNLWDKKLPKLEALRQAQLALLKRYDQARGQLRGPDEVPLPAKSATGGVPAGGAPFYWAAFVLSGDWR